MRTVNLTTRMAYAQAKEVMGYFRPYVPSQRSICGIIDLLGPHAEGVLDDLAVQGTPRAGAGDRLGDDRERGAPGGGHTS